jgi:hypothetical protein
MSSELAKRSAKALSNLHASGDEVDCIDKKCFLVHQLEQNCVISLPTNNSLCNIPCITEGCNHETHHSIVCPIWVCTPVSTTSKATTSTTQTTTSRTTSTTKSTTSTTKSTTWRTTTTTSTTSTPSTTVITQSTTASFSTTTPPPMPITCHSVVMYSSVGFNFLLLVALVTVLVKYFKLKREDREFEAEISRRLHTPHVDPVRGIVGQFSIGSLENLLAIDENERAPLLNRSQNQIIRPSRSQQNYSNASTVSDDTFLNHRPPDYMNMKTFKPEPEKPKQTNESTV